MFRSTLRFLHNKKPTFAVCKECYSSAVPQQKWDLLTAVCLERKPIVSQEPNELEKRFQKMLADVEFEHSVKNDFELKHESEVKQLEVLKRGESDDADISLKATAQDFMDASMEELNKFKTASRITEADKKNDVRSLNRKLDKNVIFVLNQKIGDKKFYLLPQGLRQEGETLRQTAERILKQSCGPELKAQFYGNAPAGFYKYKYPKTLRKDGSAVGAKVFIYFARYINGTLPEKGVDYKWLDRTEMEKVFPLEYKKSVTEMLMDE